MSDQLTPIPKEATNFSPKKNEYYQREDGSIIEDKPTPDTLNERALAYAKRQVLNHLPEINESHPDRNVVLARYEADYMLREIQRRHDYVDAIISTNKDPDGRLEPRRADRRLARAFAEKNAKQFGVRSEPDIPYPKIVERYENEYYQMKGFRRLDQVRSAGMTTAAKDYAQKQIANAKKQNPIFEFVSESILHRPRYEYEVSWINQRVRDRAWYEAGFDSASALRYEPTPTMLAAAADITNRFIDALKADDTWMKVTHRPIHEAMGLEAAIRDQIRDSFISGLFGRYEPNSFKSIDDSIARYEPQRPQPSPDFPDAFLSEEEIRARSDDWERRERYEQRSPNTDDVVSYEPR